MFSFRTRCEQGLGQRSIRRWFRNGAKGNNANDRKHNPGARSTKFDYRVKVDTAELTFAMVKQVADSWELMVKKLPGWKEGGGEIFLRKMIEIAPETVPMFGFRVDMNHNDPGLMEDEKFKERAVAFMDGVDMTIAMLGPDTETLEEVMFELGVKHQKVPCSEEHWPVVCESVMFTLKKVLGSSFTDDLEQKWTILFRFMSYHMVRGFNAVDHS